MPERTDSELEAAIDSLYGLPAAEFTAARDQLVKQLRADKRRDAANRVKGLRRPSVAAWALNQLQRQRPGEVNDLLKAAQKLRQAQEQLLTGGRPGALREAAAEERERVQTLAQAAQELLADAERTPNATTAGRVFSTLRAVAGNDEAAALLAQGRLTNDYELSDLGLGMGGEVDVPAPARTAPAASAGDPPERPSRSQAQITAGARAAAALARRRRTEERKLEQALERHQETRAALRDAEQQAEQAEQELRRAQRDLDRANIALERAQAQAARTAERVAGHREALKQLEPE